MGNDDLQMIVYLILGLSILAIFIGLLKIMWPWLSGLIGGDLSWKGILG